MPAPQLATTAQGFRSSSARLAALCWPIHEAQVPTSQRIMTASGRGEWRLKRLKWGGRHLPISNAPPFGHSGYVVDFPEAAAARGGVADESLSSMLPGFLQLAPHKLVHIALRPELEMVSEAALGGLDGLFPTRRAVACREIDAQHQGWPVPREILARLPSRGKRMPAVEANLAL